MAVRKNRRVKSALRSKYTGAVRMQEKSAPHPVQKTSPRLRGKKPKNSEYTAARGESQTLSQVPNRLKGLRDIGEGTCLDQFFL